MIKRALALFFLCLPAWLGLSSCAPGLGKTVRVDYIETLGLKSSVERQWREIRLRLGEFGDERTTRSMGVIDDRELSAQGDIAASVRAAVAAELRQAGAELSLFAGPFLNGAVTEWQIEVKPGFPLTEVEARAALRIRVNDGAGNAVYSASYAGSVVQKHPLVTQEQVERILGQAMAFAIKEALQDDRLLAALR